jgi:hypothetical protein
MDEQIVMKGYTKQWYLPNKSVIMLLLILGQIFAGGVKAQDKESTAKTEFISLNCLSNHK